MMRLIPPASPPKLETEDDLDYELFSLYCQLGVERSAEKVAQMYYKNLINPDTDQPRKVSTYQLRELSRNNDWVARAKTYDIQSLAYERGLLAEKVTASREDWLIRMSKSNEILTQVFIDLGSEHTEYKLLKSAGEYWLDKNKTKLKNNPQLLIQGNQIQSARLANLEKVLKLLKEAWCVKEQSEIIKTIDSEIIECDAIYGDDDGD